MNQIYYKPNTPKLRKEIYELIAYKPEKVESLLTGWFELDPMPMDFFKSFWLSTFNQGVHQQKILESLKDKAIEFEKFDLIKTFLTMQLVKWQEMYQASIDRSNLNVVKFLVEDENFIYNPKDIDAICVYSYRSPDIHFVNKVNQLLTQNHIKIENYSYINHSTVEHLMNAIFQSGKSDYIELAQTNLNFKFSSTINAPVNSLYKSFREKFYTFSIPDQASFLSFYMSNQQSKKQQDFGIILEYIKENKSAKNLPIMAQVVSQLIDNKIISKNQLYGEIVPDEHNFYGFYQIFNEKKQLEANIIAEKKSTTNKKLKV